MSQQGLQALHAQLLQEDGSKSSKNTNNSTHKNIGHVAGSVVEEERVEVNQRHLIDKILARYSADFTVFRELLQNSNDAGATHVEILLSSTSDRPSTEGPSDVVSTATTDEPGSLPDACTSIAFRNNGRPFDGQDWQRLRKIAEGNPDVDKIGFFGVGFYSLFSICEEPMIQSGLDCMVFRWRGDQLYTRRIHTSADTIADHEPPVSPWTTFYMKLREPMDLPKVEVFGKFLCASLVFPANLLSIRVQCDDITMLRLEKKFLQMSRTEMLHLQLDIECLVVPQKNFLARAWNRWFGGQSPMTALFSRSSSDEPQAAALISEAPLNYDKIRLFFQVARAQVQVRVPAAFAKEMERVTKKAPPQQSWIQMIFTGADEYETTMAACEKSSAFRGLVPFPDQGRIFIGFQTHQTTGLPAHIAAHLIPTVERESIDFVDRTLAVWNEEVLFSAGILARIVYENGWDRFLHAKADSWRDPQAIQYAIHWLKSHTFKPSSPHPVVGSIIQGGFYRCLKEPPCLLSTRGILDASRVRAFNSMILEFSETVPMVPEEMMQECEDFLELLTRNGFLKPVSVTDVLNELNSRVLKKQQFTSLIKWWLIIGGTASIPSDLAGRFFLTARLEMPSGASSNLASFRFFLNPRVIPPSMEIPQDTLPYEISKQLSYDELIGLDLSELTILRWLLFVAADVEQFQSDPLFARSILEVLSRAWTLMSQDMKIQIISFLKEKTCVPIVGDGAKLRKPEETYFRSASLFSDLPFVDAPSLSETFLKDIGVRTVVDLQMVFDRLDDLNWDHVQLIKYLASVQDQLSDKEYVRLKNTPLLPCEPAVLDKKTSTRQSADNAIPVVAAELTLEEVQSSSRSKSLLPVPGSIPDHESVPDDVPFIRFKVSALYSPRPAFRSLGLRIVDWPNEKWKPNSSETLFLEKLGLRKVVPLPELLGLCSCNSPPLRAKALKHFLDNFDSIYQGDYFPQDCRIAFVPCQNDTLCLPSDCYSDPGCGVMGFSVLRQDLLSHAGTLGILRDPATNFLIERLSLDPPDLACAPSIFSYLSTRVKDFTEEQMNFLTTLSFIPVVTISGTKLAAPDNVYFGSVNSAMPAEGFDKVDFGLSANTFLKACGVKNEPTPTELARLLCSKGGEILSSNGVETYLKMSRRIAAHFDVIVATQPKLVETMKTSPWLLAYQRSQSATPGTGNPALEYALTQPSRIALIDDAVLQDIFNPLYAPLEMNLEDFYSALGSTAISRQVKEEFVPKGAAKESSAAYGLQTLIRERAALLTFEGDSNSRRVNFGPVSRDTKNDAIVRRLAQITVREVTEIRLRRQWQSMSHEQATSACLSNVKGSSDSNVILITTSQGPLDYFDVAVVLSRHFLKRGGLNSCLLLSTLLSTSLTNLKRKGFPVDRLLGQEAAREEKFISAAVKSHKEREMICSSTENVQPLSKPASSIIDVDSQIAAIKEIFPGCDSEFLRHEVSAGKSHQEIVEELLKNENYPKESGGSKNSQSPGRQGLIDVRSSSSDLMNEQNENPDLPKLPDSSSKKGALRLLSKILNPSKSPSENPTKTDVKLESEPAGSYQERKKALSERLKRSVDECGPKGVDFLKSDAKELRAAVKNAMVCDVLPAQDIKKIGETTTADGVVFPFYIHSVHPDSVDPNSPKSISFATLLLKLARNVFDLKPSALHIVHASSSTTMAFNSERSLFFNMSYYQYTASSESQNLLMWYVIICHELAHNFISIHDVDHGRFMSAFFEQYLPAFLPVFERAS